MKILVNEIEEHTDWTISDVSIDNVKCFYSVEDEYREQKIKGETRVDAGTYPLELRDSPKFSHKWLVNPDGGFEIVWHEDATEEQKKNWKPHQLIWIKNTPRHEFCLIHWGNSDDDTEGCLVIGLSLGYDGKRQRIVKSSRICYQKWYPVMAREVAKGNSTIEFKRINGK